ncbi:MAG: sirohydrochlorin cobaltochelatase [Ruminiclostridium sp.]|nr:sirohydrochlorin cobaltochelatase [Ruminiclostridium sp.]
MKLRKIAAMALSTAICALALAGCGGNAPAATTEQTTTAATTTSAAATEETTTAAPETTAAETTEEPAEDDTDVSGKPVILTVSFGTSYNDSRDKTIGAIEAAIQDANPDKEVRRAFTSQIIIDKLKERDSLVIDNVDEAFARLETDGVKELIVQPTHVMSGFEYDDLMAVVKANADKFDSVKVGSPLLTTDADYTEVIDAITAATAEYDDGETAIVFMGHGTEHASNATYAKLQTMLTDAGKNNYCIGTVEAGPSIDDVVAFAKNGGYKRVVLEPLMVVAGDHANNDMAGDEEDSWKTILTNEGFEVVPVLRGLGEIEAIQKIYVDHVRSAAALSGAAVADGEYTITAETDSSMFKIVDCELTVAGGKMTAVITLSGSGFNYLYPGTAADAEKAAESDLIAFTENSEGQHVYTIPVEALDKPIKCAAQSLKKSTWYDHEITFRSESIA